MSIYWSTLHCYFIKVAINCVQQYKLDTSMTPQARIVCEQVVYCYRVLLQLSVHSSDLMLELVLYCYPVTSRSLSACSLAHPTHPTQPRHRHRSRKKGKALQEGEYNMSKEINRVWGHNYSGLCLKNAICNNVWEAHWHLSSAKFEHFLKSWDVC